MLEFLGLRNFKAAQDVGIRLEPLTLLTGLNSSGKSTVLQSIALIRQSLVANRLSGLSLHGSIVQLGTFGEMRTEGGQSDVIEIVLRYEAEELRATLGVDEVDSSYALLRAPASNDWSIFSNTHFQFLHADRISPQTLFPRSSEASHAGGRLGSRGEYTAEFLASQASKSLTVPEQRRAPPLPAFNADLARKVSPTPGLLEQTAGWLQYLSPGVRISSDLLAGTDSARILFDYVGRAGVLESGKQLRPVNVGFGLTYCLPVVVACLSAPRGALLLIENPEAHLHPQGQFAMGDLLARTAADGVQLVVETHSDHILNAIRLAVKAGTISSGDVVIHYFSRDLESGFAEIESPSVLQDGRLSAWPNGFFDQWDMALDELLK